MFGRKKKKDELQLMMEAREKAPKILETIKDTSLTELDRRESLQLQLVEITPQLMEELKRLLEEEARSDQDFEMAIQGVIGVLTVCQNDKKISEKERMQIRDKLVELSEIYKEYQETKKRESTKKTRTITWATVLTVLGGIALVALGGKRS